MTWNETNPEPRRRRLRIAIPADSSFVPAIEAAGHEAVKLPPLEDQHFNRPVEKRIADGQVYRAFFETHDVDLLLDLETSAMTFVPGVDGGNTYTLTHTLFDIPYVAHYIDPITETMQQVDWAIRWRLLEHPAWIKWVWEGGHACELQQFGIPNVLPLTTGADDGDYPTDPLPENPTGIPVGFVGHPATSWFGRNVSTPSTALLPGYLAAACCAENTGAKFHDVYYDCYRLGEPPSPSDPPQVRAQKAAQYFNAKLSYCFYLAVKQRDRFVLFLKKQLGDKFDLVGDFWRRDYRIEHAPRVWGREALVRKFRETAVNLNLIKGNNETGLNLRHFEITAAGGFMLTYPTAELSRYFEVGKECVTFAGERDLLEKIRYYLAHPRQRIEIALAGQRRTLGEHLYSHRINELVKIIRTPSGTPLVYADDPAVPAISAP